MMLFSNKIDTNWIYSSCLSCPRLCFSALVAKSLTTKALRRKGGITLIYGSNQ